jgi:hypothetical protein
MKGPAGTRSISAGSADADAGAEAEADPDPDPDPDPDADADADTDADPDPGTGAGAGADPDPDTTPDPDAAGGASASADAEAGATVGSVRPHARRATTPRARGRCRIAAERIARPAPRGGRALGPMGGSGQASRARPESPCSFRPRSSAALSRVRKPAA